MQVQVEEVGVDVVEQWLFVGGIGYYQGNLVFVQQFDECWVDEVFMVDFYGMLQVLCWIVVEVVFVVQVCGVVLGEFLCGGVVVWQVGEEIGEQFVVEVYVWWELLEEWVEVLVQGEGVGGEEVCQWFVDFVQVLYVGDVMWGFDVENEVFGGVFGLVVEVFGCLQGVEGVVDFDVVYCL